MPYPRRNRRTDMIDTNAFAKLVPGFDFLQGLMQNAGQAVPAMGQWIAPTLNPEELEKRIEEALGSVADGFDVTADLESRHALHGDLDALTGDRVRQHDADLASGQLELADLVDQRQHERAATHDDLDALVSAGGRGDLALLVEADD